MAVERKDNINSQELLEKTLKDIRKQFGEGAVMKLGEKRSESS